MNPSYIATNLEELHDAASPAIQNLIEGGEVGNAASTLGRIYKLPVSLYVPLSNLISFLLIGALKPEDAVRGIMDMLHLSEGDALKLAQDLDKSILEKARIQILGKAPTDMVELTFKEGRSAEDLRKEILDTTKRESALVKEQSSMPLPKQEETVAQETPVPPTSPNTESAASPAPEQKEKRTAAAGSRSQLLEQLQVLDDIPDDEEISARLAKIKEQISSIEKKDDSALDSKIPLQNFMFGEKSGDEVKPEFKSATYSKAPTKYNVDPYREIPEES